MLWTGQWSDNTNTIYLQIYNRNTASWQYLDDFPENYNSGHATYNDPRSVYAVGLVDTDYELSGSVADLTNYKDGANLVACRIYQLQP